MPLYHLLSLDVRIITSSYTQDGKPVLGPDGKPLMQAPPQGPGGTAGPEVDSGPIEPEGPQPW